MTHTPRIAVIGCGTVAQRFHLPAMQTLGLRPQALVDVNVALARELADRYQVPESHRDYQAVLGGCEAALLAVPTVHHATIARDLLMHGIHVLVEKPLATSYRECIELERCASATRRVLAVGLMRRHLLSARWTKGLIESGALGRIGCFDLREGQPLAWDVQSAAFFSRPFAGGGVLADMGAHSLDLLLWLLGPYSRAKYRDDSLGGVEADCLLQLDLHGGATGIVELSRSRWLRNTLIIRGDLGELEVSLFGNHVQAKPRALLRRSFEGTAGNRLPSQSLDSLFVSQLEAWLRAIRSGGAGLYPSGEAAESVRLIEECYAVRQPWVLPWMEFSG